MLTKPLRASAPLTFTYKTIFYFPNPLPLTLDVHLPPSNLATASSASSSSKTVVPSPTLLLIHQGGFINKSKSNLPPWLLDLAHEKGWIVVAPDYRLLVGGLAPVVAPEESEGRGRKNDEGKGGVDLGDSLDDVLAAYEWMVGGSLERVLEKEGGEAERKIDLEKLVVVGMSAGGALSLLLPSQLASTLPQPSSVLSIYPITRPFQPYYNTDRNKPSSPYQSFNTSPSFEQVASNLFLAPVVASATDPSDRSDLWSWVVQNGRFGEMCLGKGLGEFAGKGKADRDSRPDQKTKTLKARLSPLVGVNSPKRGSYPRTYILHGDADVWIPFEESEWAKERLEEAGVEVEFVRVDGEDHGFEEEMRLGVDGKYDGLWRKVGDWIEAGWK